MLEISQLARNILIIFHSGHQDPLRTNYTQAARSKQTKNTSLNKQPINRQREKTSSPRKNRISPRHSSIVSSERSRPFTTARALPTKTDRASGSSTAARHSPRPGAHCFVPAALLFHSSSHRIQPRVREFDADFFFAEFPRLPDCTGLCSRKLRFASGEEAAFSLRSDCSLCAAGLSVPNRIVC